MWICALKFTNNLNIVNTNRHAAIAVPCLVASVFMPPVISARGSFCGFPSLLLLLAVRQSVSPPSHVPPSFLSSPPRPPMSAPSSSEMSVDDKITMITRNLQEGQPTHDRADNGSTSTRGDQMDAGQERNADATCGSARSSSLLAQ